MHWHWWREAGHRCAACARSSWLAGTKLACAPCSWAQIKCLWRKERCRVCRCPLRAGTDTGRGCFPGPGTSLAGGNASLAARTWRGNSTRSNSTSRDARSHFCVTLRHCHITIVITHWHTRKFKNVLYNSQNIQNWIIKIEHTNVWSECVAVYASLQFCYAMITYLRVFMLLLVWTVI